MKVGAMDIFDEGQDACINVLKACADHCWNGFPSERLAGHEPAFSYYQLVLAVS
jgi:hypothetical protein